MPAVRSRDIRTARGALGVHLVPSRVVPEAHRPDLVRSVRGRHIHGRRSRIVMHRLRTRHICKHHGQGIVRLVSRGNIRRHIKDDQLPPLRRRILHIDPRQDRLRLMHCWHICRRGRISHLRRLSRRHILGRRRLKVRKLRPRLILHGRRICMHPLSHGLLLVQHKRKHMRGMPCKLSHPGLGVWVHQGLQLPARLLRRRWHRMHRLPRGRILRERRRHNGPALSGCKGRILAQTGDNRPVLRLHASGGLCWRLDHLAGSPFGCRHPLQQPSVSAHIDQDERTHSNHRQHPRSRLDIGALSHGNHILECLPEQQQHSQRHHGRFINFFLIIFVVFVFDVVLNINIVVNIVSDHFRLNTCCAQHHIHIHGLDCDRQLRHGCAHGQVAPHAAADHGVNRRDDRIRQECIWTQRQHLVCTDAFLDRDRLERSGGPQ
eukprot:comp22448_c0_seq1/m.55179 comp22448_c0_seq1/g.55179  ORF comp22448_c0_seq1/g.55179 comp22448_c0_seq1/m.55179 type:complete len:433 (-) comp22448_c0_seq1:88-1386(-)